MRSRADLRHRNLESLIGEAGSARSLARRADTSDAYLSQVRNRTLTARGRTRGIGDRLASKLEKAMGKPAGWMDELHDLEANPPAVDRESQYKPWSSRGGNNSEQGFYPLLSWVQAGDWTEVPETSPDDDSEMFRCPVRCGPRTFVLRIRGASMEPKYHEGDLIFVDPDVFPDSGRHVVVCTPGSSEATFKQLIEEDGRRYLRALNPDWPDPIIEARIEARVCGVVVCKAAGVLTRE